MPQLVSAAPTYANRADNFTLKWNKVQDADRYLVQASTEQTFTSLFRSSPTSDTVKAFSGFSQGQQYYWRVQASNFVGSGPWSDVWNFTANVTGVKEEGIPTEYSISQNYPNPFNPTTTISYQLPVDSQVTLKVYDVLGREIETLVNERQHAGKYSLSLDGRNLSTGVYYYRLQTANEMTTRNMALLK